MSATCGVQGLDNLYALCTVLHVDPVVPVVPKGLYTKVKLTIHWLTLSYNIGWLCMYKFIGRVTHCPNLWWVRGRSFEQLLSFLRGPVPSSEFSAHGIYPLALPPQSVQDIQTALHCSLRWPTVLTDGIHILQNLHLVLLFSSFPLLLGPWPPASSQTGCSNREGGVQRTEMSSLPSPVPRPNGGQETVL